MSADWKRIVATVAPGIATALGGPLAGLAVKAIGGALGLGDGASEDAVAAAVTGASPDQLLAIKQADQAFKVKMRELDVDLERISMQDRDSARRREADTKDWAPKVLAAIIVLTWASVQWFILRNSVPEDMRELIMRVLGTLDAALMLVLAYYFGSSAGSKAKDDIVGAMTRK